MPFPHFISYHNIVASCDGILLEKKIQKDIKQPEIKSIDSCCCNIKRGNRFVLPIFLKLELVGAIQYSSEGYLTFKDDFVWDEESADENEWFDKDHLNLNNNWIINVRKFWYKVAMSEYTDKDVDLARQPDKENFRQNILDDIDPTDEFSSWGINDTVWNLLSEYSWFYQYYKANP